MIDVNRVIAQVPGRINASILRVREKQSPGKVLLLNQVFNNHL
jgi:hypothetical protein